MALNKYHYIELDTKRSPRISLQNIVAGETGNRLWITVTNNGETIDMSEKENDAWKYRVCLRIDSDLGTRRQDSAMENSGITFIEANTGYHGMINIRLSKDSFTAGMNHCRLEIYSKTWQPNDTLICSAEFQFTAAKNPTGENAGNVYPSLIKLENELATLKTETIAATNAANSAAESAEYEAGQANTAATSANQAASAARLAAASANTAATKAENKALAADTAAASADQAAAAANSAASSATSAAHAADSAAQNADAKAADAEAAAATAQTAASAANAATAAANAAAQIAKKGAYNIKHNAVWSGSMAIGETVDIGSVLAQIAQDNVIVTQIATPDADDQSVITLVEIGRDATTEIIYFRSAQAWSGYIYLATMDYSGNNTPAEIIFSRRFNDTVVKLAVSDVDWTEAPSGASYVRAGIITFATDPDYADIGREIVFDILDDPGQNDERSVRMRLVSVTRRNAITLLLFVAHSVDYETGHDQTFVAEVYFNGTSFYTARIRKY